MKDASFALTFIAASSMHNDFASITPHLTHAGLVLNRKTAQEQLHSHMAEIIFRSFTEYILLSK
jgi:hypothetical protein